MRTYREILNFLLIREQLSLGWKIGFFIVCGALVFGSAALMRIKVQAVDRVGTVLSHGTDPIDKGHIAYLIVRLDNGETVRAHPIGPLDYRANQRGVVREITTNFFGLKKHEFKGYLDKPHDE